MGTLALAAAATLLTISPPTPLPTTLPAVPTTPVGDEPRGDPVCAARDAILSSLARQFSEAPRELGLANNGVVIELTTSTRGNTWTLLLTRPDGTSCVVAAGEGWEAAPQSVAGQPL